MSSIDVDRVRGCSRCGGRATVGQDFHSGVYHREGRLVRLHGPRHTVRCLSTRCGHVEVVTERSGPDDSWIMAFQVV